MGRWSSAPPAARADGIARRSYSAASGTGSAPAAGAATSPHSRGGWLGLGPPPACRRWERQNTGRWTKHGEAARQARPPPLRSGRRTSRAARQLRPPGKKEPALHLFAPPHRTAGSEGSQVPPLACPRFVVELPRGPPLGARARHASPRAPSPAGTATAGALWRGGRATCQRICIAMPAGHGLPAEWGRLQ